MMKFWRKIVNQARGWTEPFYGAISIQGKKCFNPLNLTTIFCVKKHIFWNKKTQLRAIGDMRVLTPFP